MSQLRRRLRACAAVLPLVLACGRARAQFESASVADVQLNLVNPGGKSLSMGGAFVALADDATAAYANPAGLPQLSAPVQAGLSGKTFLFRPDIDSLDYASSASSTTSTTVSSRSTELDFASVVGAVVPGKLNLGLYRAVNLRYELNEAETPVYRIDLGNGRSYQAREAGGVDLRNEVYGLSAGWASGPVSIGAGVFLSHLKYELVGPSGRFLLAVKGSVGSTDIDYQQSVTASVDSSVRAGWVVGARAELEQAHRIVIGASYRHSPRHDVSYGWHATGTFAGAPLDLTAQCGRTGDAAGRYDNAVCGSFKVPDDFSIGIAGAPTNRLIVALEAQRVWYSQLEDGFVPLSTYASQAPQSPAVFAVLRGVADDATVLRAGLQYSFVGAVAVDVRAGFYHEPAHGMRVELKEDANQDAIPDASNKTVVITTPPLTAAYERIFPGGHARNHVTGGLGVNLSRAVSFDLAYDYSGTSQFGTASLFVRF
jgi:long-subunit fatty acid transport protein